jgi:hypothetical protein
MAKGDVNEIKINAEELQILLNILRPNIKISYPLYDFDFLHAKEQDVGYNLKIVCNQRNFDKQRHRFGSAGKELPSYSDFRGGLLSSGVMHYLNMNEFKSKLKTYDKLNKEVKYSLDTNLLYHRFITNHGLLKPSDVVLVSTVGDEIKAKLNYKYSPNQLESIKRTAKFQRSLIDELWNKKIKRSRKAAYIGSREYKSIMDGVADELNEVEKSSKDGRNNDMIIVETLSQFEKTGHVLPVLLTADDAMVDLCITESLEYFKFDIPHVIDASSSSVKHFIQMIFNFAVVFGFIKVNSVVVFGEFKGKTSNNADELKLVFQNDQIINEFQRDLRLCRKLMELGIEK